MKKLIISLGIIFIVAQSADAFLTMWAAHNLPGFQEMNPILAPIAGTWLSPLVKILPSALIAWGLYRLGTRFPKTQLVTIVGLVGVVVFYAAVLGSNMVKL